VMLHDSLAYMPAPDDRFPTFREVWSRPRLPERPTARSPGGTPQRRHPGVFARTAHERMPRTL